MAFPQVSRDASNPRAPEGGGGCLCRGRQREGGTFPVAPGTNEVGVGAGRRLIYMSNRAGQSTESPIRVNTRSNLRHYPEPCGICQCAAELPWGVAVIGDAESGRHVKIIESPLSPG